MIDARQMFVHKQAIRHDNQQFFTGRQTLLSTALDALAVPGAAMIVHGDAGVGKTSLAWQLLEILQGIQHCLPDSALPLNIRLTNTIVSGSSTTKEWLT